MHWLCLAKASRARFCNTGREGSPSPTQPVGNQPMFLWKLCLAESSGNCCQGGATTSHTHFAFLGLVSRDDFLQQVLRSRARGGSCRLKPVGRGTVGHFPAATLAAGGS